MQTWLTKNKFLCKNTFSIELYYTYVYIISTLLLREWPIEGLLQYCSSPYIFNCFMSSSLYPVHVLSNSGIILEYVIIFWNYSGIAILELAQ
jgi:hypothetical protein